MIAVVLLFSASSNSSLLPLLKNIVQIDDLIVVLLKRKLSGKSIPGFLELAEKGPNYLELMSVLENENRVRRVFRGS